MELDFTAASRAWLEDRHSHSMGRCKKTKPPPWHHARCGFLYPNGEYCKKKSYFGGMSRHQKHDVDMCDRKINCYHHRGRQDADYSARMASMEPIIVQRAATQQHLFLSPANMTYLKSLQEKVKLSEEQRNEANEANEDT